MKVNRIYIWHFLVNALSYDKILRVAGKHFRGFLHSIDQLHASNRFNFPKKKSPLFRVTKEDDNGATLNYK